MRATLRRHKAVPSTNQDEASELVVGQINFGLAYAREAHAAYRAGNFEYGEVARKIAVNAYAAAIRFSANLLQEPKPALIRQIEQLESELDAMLQPMLQAKTSGLRSIA